MIRRLLSLVLMLWLLGFAVFMLVLSRPLNDVVTDAIVVPTGGPGRIQRGLELLQARAAKRMLITGVAPEVEASELAAEYKVSDQIFDCCIDLGQEAVDTKSNATETARWVRDHRYRTVRLVTSDWHMARARLELAYALGKDVEVVGDGVPSHPRFATLIAEYNKFLLRQIALWTGIGR